MLSIRPLVRTAVFSLLAASPLSLGAQPPGFPENHPGNWVEHFDTYAVGTALHGVGGWQGWNGDPSYDASTSSTRALSAPASVEIGGSSLLVHPHSGITAGKWTFTAWQYIASSNLDLQHLVILNTYPPAFLGDWSVVICFDAPSGLVRDDPGGLCNGTTNLPIGFDRWVQIRVEIDLDADHQAFYYDGQLLYQGSWNNHVDCCGIARFAAVALSALHGATPSAASLHYDDLSLSTLPFSDGFEGGDPRNWHSAVR